MSHHATRGGTYTGAPDRETDPVREFYSQHPYPPPVGNLDRAREEWRDERRHRADYHLLWPDQPYRADLDILVAGCGTWQAAKYAVCRPLSRVVGIDVSPTSLEETERLRRKYQLPNLATRLLPIERAGELEQQFDLIVCTGVLHHLADPGAGLRALRSVLKPGGVMYLMVYAPYGRTGVYMLQDYCRRLGLRPSESDIRELMTVVKTLPQQHPLAALLRGSRDADNADAMADALLNPRDRSYSVTQLFELIDGNGLTFRRWYSQAPYLYHCGAMAATPHAARLAKLPTREQYAAMELWRGAVASHSLVVSCDGGSPARMPVDFDDERRWLQYVPVRLPGTVCVQDRLPLGAAAALLSRYHTFPDLVLFIDAEEKRMVDRIDGHRRIGEIADSPAGAERVRCARGLFERLFSYDQVVFDTSSAR
jgi:SAM-dependent methyltransferase